MRRSYQSPSATGRVLRYGAACGLQDSLPYRGTAYPSYCCSPQHSSQEAASPSKPIRIDINVNINININGSSQQTHAKKHRHHVSGCSNRRRLQKPQKQQRTGHNCCQTVAKLTTLPQNVAYVPAILQKSPEHRLARVISEPSFQNVGRAVSPVPYQPTLKVEAQLFEHTKPMTSTLASRSNMHMLPAKQHPRMQSPPIGSLRSFVSSGQVQLLSGQASSTSIPAASHDNQQNAEQEEEAPAFIPMPPLVVHPHLPSCSFRDPLSEPLSSNSYSEVHTMKLHFDCLTPIKQIDQLLGSDQNIQQPNSIHEPVSKKSFDSPNKLADLQSQESLVVNRGIENFISPEDFAASLSTIRSIQQGESVSLQRIYSGVFPRKIEVPFKKSYAEHFSYVIKEDPNNEHTDSCGPSAQGSNLRSSGTSVAQQIKIQQEEIISSYREIVNHKKGASSGATTQASVQIRATSPRTDYRFERKIESHIDASSKLRSARVVPEPAKARLPRNNLALWDGQ